MPILYSKANYNATGVDDPNTSITYHYNWQYFGIPLKTLATAGPTLNDSYVRKWDETKDASTHWVPLTSASTLSSFVGYEITQESPKTFSFSGILENSDKTLALSYTPSANYPGQNVYANPYLAAIDITKLVFSSMTDSTVYLFNCGSYGDWAINSGSFGTNAGQYLSIPQNLAGKSNLPLSIPSMQGFTVRTTAAGATLGINYNSVVTKNTDQQRIRAEKNNSKTTQICTMIDVKGKNFSDRMWIFTVPKSTYSFDKGWDGLKFTGDGFTPQLFAKGKDGSYQVYTVPDMNDTELIYQGRTDSEDTLTFTNFNLGEQYAGIYLVDLVQNKTIDVTESGSTYVFRTENTSNPVKRFKIVTRPFEKSNPDVISQLKAFSSEGTLFIQNFSNIDGECKVYDIAGHYLQKRPFTANSVTAIANNLLPGAYIVVGNTSEERISKRLIVR